jgi:hypothetical protein
MSEDICYIYIFAQIKMIMCGLRSLVCILGCFGSVEFYLGFQL